MTAPSIHLGVRAETEGVIRRRAVKAVIEVDGSLLLLRSATGGDYKFPGGGAEDGEEDAATLARELDEECGRDVLAVGSLVLRVLEEHPAREDPQSRFEMESRYYDCTVSGVRRTPALSQNERREGLHEVLVPWHETATTCRGSTGSCRCWSSSRGSAVRAEPSPYGGAVIMRLALAVLAVLALFAVVALFRIARHEWSRRSRR
jgi:8-oxo-dGTP pyrophosphatase MutT (NUDIX family)